MLNSPEMKRIVSQALSEDVGDGDVTSETILPSDLWMEGRIIAKQAGVIAGLEVAQMVFALVDEQARLDPQVSDGDPVEPRDIAATLSGPGRALLGGERVALNFLQRMSGIATMTRAFVEAVKGTGAVILDTRKTAPGLRAFDKWAVCLGGGQNHRVGLFDMVLIKENHIASSGGSITEAVTRVRARDTRRRPIEVEVRNLAELAEALSLIPDRILLDNMSLAEMREAVRAAGGRVPLEASGNVSLDNVAAVAATGVNFISVGALTHSVQALDLSVLLDLSRS